MNIRPPITGELAELCAVLRNPLGLPEDQLAQARHDAADELERLDAAWKHSHDISVQKGAELARLREQEPVAWIQHHKAGDNLVWDDPGGKKSPMYAAAPPAQPAAQPVQRRPALASIESAPACLNMNDKAMWVTGWNECRDAIAARPGGAS